MTKTVLTRRGKIVLFIAFILLWAWLNDLTTPDACKVPLEEMPQWCKDLLYP